MRILVVGAGAREHAIVRHLCTETGGHEVLAAPGNPGIGELAAILPVDLADTAEVAALAARVRPDLVVVGPEGPLVGGIADALAERQIACFGPSAAAARIEGSKGFAKQLMADAGVPTGKGRQFAALEDALQALSRLAPPFVVKLDGLAAGKGVTVTSERAEAEAACRAGLRRPGDRLVLEEFLAGPEISLFAVCDGTRLAPLLPAQDFKRLGDGDRGPNTGGMGAYAPLPWAPPDLVEHVVERVLAPTVAELDRRGSPFRGLLYAGLALTDTGPAVIEFNARFGDPETQALLALLDSPLGELLAAAAHGDLAATPAPRWASGHAVTVVVAAPGYPGAPVTGAPVTGLAEAAALPGVRVDHAGTAWRDGQLVSCGGRVVSVTASADTLAAARETAYRAVGRIQLAGAQLRTDVAAAAAG